MRYPIAMAVASTLFGTTVAPAQYPPGRQGSSNMQVLAHIPLSRGFTASDLDIEQELSRPYAYISRMMDLGTDIIDLKDPTKARIIYSWQIENPELHQGAGGMDNKYFKLKGRYYDVQSLQFGRNGPDADLAAVVFDVTGLTGYRCRTRGGPDPGARYARWLSQHLRLQAFGRPSAALRDSERSARNGAWSQHL